MYFPDLTPHTYDSPSSNGINIGWLEFGKPFDQGEVAPELLAKLKELAKNPVDLYRGYHVCEYCQANGVALVGNKYNMECLGNGSIHIPVNGKNAKDGLFIAPALLPHYMDEHGYLPPNEFIVAATEFFAIKP